MHAHVLDAWQTCCSTALHRQRSTAQHSAAQRSAAQRGRTRGHGRVVEWVVPVPGGHAPVVVLQHPVQALWEGGGGVGGGRGGRLKEKEKVQTRWSLTTRCGGRVREPGYLVTMPKRLCPPHLTAGHISASFPAAPSTPAVATLRPAQPAQPLHTPSYPPNSPLTPTWMYDSTTARRPASPDTRSFSR